MVTRNIETINKYARFYFSSKGVSNDLIEDMVQEVILINVKNKNIQNKRLQKTEIVKDAIDIYRRDFVYRKDYRCTGENRNKIKESDYKYFTPSVWEDIIGFEMPIIDDMIDAKNLLKTFTKDKLSWLKKKKL
jgi:hypothetical protein